MTLKLQLLILSLLTLALPWAGCQTVREMETALRQGQANTLQATAEAVAATLKDQATSLYPFPALSQTSTKPEDLFAWALPETLELDGDITDWHLPKARSRRFTQPRGKDRIHASLGVSGDFLYLHIDARDDEFIPFANPGQKGDRLLLIFDDPKGWRRRIEVTADGPGPIRGRSRQAAKIAGQVHGYLRLHPKGWGLEVEIPVSLVGSHFGFAVVDVDQTGPEQSIRTMGTIKPFGNAQPGLLVYSSAPLSERISAFRNQGTRLRVLDQRGWPLADSGPVADRYANVANRSVAGQLYQLIMGDEPYDAEADLSADPALRYPVVSQALAGGASASWLRRLDGKAQVVAASPIYADNTIIGAIVAEQPTAAILSLTDQAVGKLLSISLMATLVVTGGLLAFAAYLSIRIRRLRDATQATVSPDGRVDVSQLSSSHRGDELGDLDRSFHSLLQRLQDSTDYLRTLASKLSHELRTPLAVVRSSLDNLQDVSADDQRYIGRAREGLDRLRSILDAMAEANRAEQAVEHADIEAFDLRELLEHSFGAYQDLHTNYRFETSMPIDPCVIDAAPDLLVQLLDKLVDNAVSFTPERERIWCSLFAEREHYEFKVANIGPTLPAHMQGQLFDSMVSVRNAGGDHTHLGFGLYIVRLIVDSHDGEIRARNLDDGSGVEFIVKLPKTRKATDSA